jgi:hypothetical protein
MSLQKNKIDWNDGTYVLSVLLIVWIIIAIILGFILGWF